jgi:hypothetical protein
MTRAKRGPATSSREADVRNTLLVTASARDRTGGSGTSRRNGPTALRSKSTVRALDGQPYTPFTSTRAAGIPPSKDTAPQAQVAGLDFGKIKAEYGVLNASLNGTKLWMPDWVEIQVGVNREFNGIKTAWVAELHMGKPMDVSKVPPYHAMTISRKSGVGWNRA